MRSLSVCLFVCPDSIKLSGVLKCFYNGDRILIKILFMVNKYADFKFRIYKIYIIHIYCCCLQFGKQISQNSK